MASSFGPQAGATASSRRRFPLRGEQAPPGRVGDLLFRGACMLAASSVIVLAVVLTVFLVMQSWPAMKALGAGFLTHVGWDPVHGQYGALAFVFGTLATSAIAMIIAVPRRLPASGGLLREGGWTGWTPSTLLGNSLGGKRLAILGMGRIGQAVARRAQAFGLKIHYHGRRRVSAQIEEELHATYWESLDQMLVRMDIISINCPHTPATYHLLSARRLKLIRPEAYIVNTARGEVIDENALARLIESEHIAGAGLDVFEHEPAVNPKLIKLARAGKVVLLPHLASATLEGRVDMGEKVIVNIKTFLDGHRPPDRVLPSML